MICRNCNRVIRDGSENCNYCGAPQYDMQPQNMGAKQPKKSIWFVLIIFICCIPIGLLVYSRDREREKKYEQALETAKENASNFRNMFGSLDCDYVKLEYTFPSFSSEYKLLEAQSTDESKLYTNEYGTQVIGISTEKIPTGKPTEADIDNVMETNYGTDYSKSTRKLNGREFYVYKYSSDSELADSLRDDLSEGLSNSEQLDIKINVYWHAEEGYVIHLMDIMYGENTNPEDAVQILNSLKIEEK